MQTIPEVQVKFLSNTEFIKELEHVFQNASNEVKIISSGPAKDPAALNFSLNEVAVLVTIIRGTFYLGELGEKIFTALKSAKTKTVVVQTPFLRAEIHVHKDLTQAEVKNILKSILKIEH